MLHSPIKALASLAWIAFAVKTLAAPIETAGEGLTEETWHKVAKGTWLVEHYSPYCSHCRAFAPKWRELVEQREIDAGKKGFHFAQVDCAANGDLCNAHEVKYYPSIFLYVDGEIYDDYPGKRTVEALSAYVDENMPGTVVWLDKEGKPERQSVESAATVAANLTDTTASDSEKTATDAGLHMADDTTATSSSVSSHGSAESSQASTADHAQSGIDSDSETSKEASAPAFMAQIRNTNLEEKRAEPASVSTPDGQVHALVGDEVRALSREDGPPAFVKFYAPWCGHCKALAPKWTELATELRGSVNVYKVDCEEGENKKVCREQKVRSYPTLLFFNKGASVEYKSKRDVTSLKEFALTALASTSAKTIGNEQDLKRAVHEKEVAIVFLHPRNANADDVSLGATVARSMLGGPPFYSSVSPDLFAALDLPADQSFLLAFKGRSTTPADVFALPPSSVSKRLQAAERWLRYAKLPLLSELNADTFDALMDIESGEPNLIGMTVLSRKGLGSDAAFEAEKAKVLRLATAWRDARRKSPELKDKRDVVWSWVDGDLWHGWVRKMYEVMGGAKAQPELIIADPKALTYWKTDFSGSPLPISAPASVIAFIRDGVYTRSARSLSSRTLAEKWGRAIVTAPHAALAAVGNNPFATLLGMAISAVVLAWYFRWLGEGKPAPPHVTKAD